VTELGLHLGKLRLQCEVLLWRHGYGWALLFVALVAVLLGQFVVLPHQKTMELHTQQQLRALLVEQAEKAQRDRGPVQPSAQAQALDQLLAVAFAEDEVGEILRRIVKTAQTHGVYLSQSDFQTHADGHGGLHQLQLSLPVQASYVQTKGFVHDVLRQLPGVSLDELVLKRDSVAQNQAEVRAKLSLWNLPGTPPETPVQQVASSTSHSPAAPTLLPLVPRSVLVPVDGRANPAPRDLFSVRSWAVAASPSAPLAAPAPMAPPVPFSYMGKRLDGAAWQVFLARADQTFIVSAGSTVDGIYRIDAVRPPTLSLTYLPLGQAQTISIGEAQ
jgi:hypothetical protein